MANKYKEENKIKIIPNAKKKLILMLVCFCLMVFSVVQVVNLARYTLGFNVSESDMVVYNWIVKLVYNEN